MFITLLIDPVDIELLSLAAVPTLIQAYFLGRRISKVEVELGELRAQISSKVEVELGELRAQISQVEAHVTSLYHLRRVEGSHRAASARNLSFPR